MIHQKIISILRQENREEPNKKGSSLFSLPDDELIRTLFLNYRVTDDGPKGLRLSTEGHILLSSYFDYHLMKLDMSRIKPYQVLFLDRATSMPWYMNAKSLIFYENEIAVRFRLSGDLDTFIELSQDLIQKS